MTTPSIDCAIAWVEGSRTRVEAGANGEGEGPAAEHVRGGRDGELLRGDVAFRRDSELWGGRRGIRGSANRKKTSSRGVLASERVARRSPAPRGSDDGTVATSGIRTKKSAEEGFFRRVTGRITTPRRVARSRSRAGTYVAGGAGLHVVHLELLLGGLLKF